jgi:hypothetical protein
LPGAGKSEVAEQTVLFGGRKVLMKTQTNGSKGSPGIAAWQWLAIAAALLAIAGSIIALAAQSIYASLTPVFLPQALAQDIANLALVAPLWLLLAGLALRGSLRAYLLWLGVLTFTVYNYVITMPSSPPSPAGASPW